MPKNTDATKSKIRSKSTRKPLRDVSNAKNAIKSANNLKKTSVDGGQKGDYSLDRLLLVHSDLSSLMKQIDELVVQALSVTSNTGKEEIKQFADVLSDVQNSLKPWVPRFQKALRSTSILPENKSEQTIERTVICEQKESTNAVMESPKQTKWESLVSPSPLVSWRAECNTEGGRQLFLLTPLPQKKAFSSKYQTSSSIRELENITFDSVINLDENDLPESVSANPIPNEVSDKEVVTKAKFVSPEKFSKTNRSMFVMTTPCLKMSPPKSCILLEPISAFSKKKNKAFYKSTPFPARAEIPSESSDSETSSCQSSDDSKVKYSENIFAIKTGNLEKTMVANYSPSWIVSPPKTCAIMEPSDEKLLENLSDNQQEDSLSCMTIKECKDIGGTIDIAESTPMIKVPMSSFRMGKHPGENTLKKELWTRFEAATTYGVRFNGSVVEDSTSKGFLDKLDEVFDADA